MSRYTPAMMLTVEDEGQTMRLTCECGLTRTFVIPTKVGWIEHAAELHRHDHDGSAPTGRYEPSRETPTAKDAK